MYIPEPYLSHSGRGSASWGRVFEFCFVIFAAGFCGLVISAISYNKAMEKNPDDKNVLCALQTADHAKSLGKNEKETAELLGRF